MDLQSFYSNVRFPFIRCPTKAAGTAIITRTLMTVTMTKVMKALGGSGAVMENRKTDISYLQNLFTLTRKNIS